MSIQIIINTVKLSFAGSRGTLEPGTIFYSHDDETSGCQLHKETSFALVLEGYYAVVLDALYRQVRLEYVGPLPRTDRPHEQTLWHIYYDAKTGATLVNLEKPNDR